eukprot:TRINITY_DN7675_c0_g1_i1.p1 TRINITY_DN7675_c0_g1~~TRINITY_DN7675_c0_g1_i1.p1  ORF type:complete len:288 (-),score=51.86 TRINITY_DN7675_c0_g1_i1:38-790(-)
MALVSKYWLEAVRSSCHRNSVLIVRLASEPLLHSKDAQERKLRYVYQASELKIGSLAKTITQADSFPILINLLRPSLGDRAAQIGTEFLGNIVFNALKQKIYLPVEVEANLIQCAINMLSARSLDVVSSAAWCLSNLSCYPNGPRLLCQTGSMTKLILFLAKQSKESEQQDIMRYIAWSLANFAAYPETAKMLIAQNGVPLLIKLVDAGASEARDQALRTLATLHKYDPLTRHRADFKRIIKTANWDTML